MASRTAIKAATILLRLLGAGVALCVPRRKSYRVLWRTFSCIFSIQDAVYGAVFKTASPWNWRARALEEGLTGMVRIRRGLDIPVDLVGMEGINQLRHDGQRVILCTAHVPLSRAAIRTIEQQHPSVLIAGHIEHTYETNWAPEEPIQLLRQGIDVLARALSFLEQRRLLISFVDYRFDYSADGITYISPGVFRLAARANAWVWFFIPQLDSNGKIRVLFHQPLPSLIASKGDADECAARFAEFVASLTSWRCIVQRPKLLK